MNDDVKFGGHGAPSTNRDAEQRAGTKQEGAAPADDNQRNAGLTGNRLTASEEANENPDDAQLALKDHIIRLQEVNQRLVVASVNSKMLADQLEQAKTQMMHLAHHDSLTNLPNRTHFEERLTQAIVSTMARGRRLALLFIDLDRFKIINDSLGHGVGDRLLQAVAERIRGGIRGTDIVSRQGGDEFIVLLSEVGQLDDLVTRIDTLHQAITAGYVIDNHVLNIGASIGISLCPDNGTDNRTLIRHADAAMYSVKDIGRNAYAFFEESMHAKTIFRQELETRLHEAVGKEQLSLSYQAQINLTDNTIAGVEAFVQWRDPTKKGVLKSGHFIPVAEECGAIVPIGRWVLHAVCEQAKRWLDAGIEFGVIAVNLSALEFASETFLSNVSRAIHATGVPPQYLRFELVGSILTQDAEATNIKLEALRELGIRIAIDDFGRGFSSLENLKRLCFDTLKIDKSFIDDIATNHINRVLVAAMVDIGKALGRQVIATGVETAEQLAFLRECRCAYGQGYLLNGPMPAEQITEFLRHGLRQG